MFETEIKSLALAVRQAVVERRATKSISIQKRVRVRRRDLNLQYRDDLSFAYFEPERIECELWNPQDFQTFLNSIHRDCAEFGRVVGAVGSKAVLVENFVRSLSIASLQGLDDEEFQAQINALCCELEGKPLPVKVTAFIDGLSVAESPLQISDFITLRKPVSGDLAEHVFIDEYGGVSFPTSETWFRLVGEFTFHTVNTGEAQRKFLRTIEALRLYRFGGVATNKYGIISRHIASGGLLFSPQRHSRFHYTLGDGDVKALSQFLKDIVPLIDDPLQMDQATTDIGIAHARYVDALFQSGGNERVITSLMTALEAIFLRNEPELTHRLAQRVAMFLKLLGTQLDAKTTYGNVATGYKIRSTFIHGSAVKGKHQPQAAALVPVLGQYTRECVLARLQDTLPKNELLATLDEAMVDSPTAHELRDHLRSIIHK